MSVEGVAVPPDPMAEAWRKSGVWGRATLDALFRRNVRREPDRVVLVDPSDRAAFTGSPARRLKAIDCERIVGALGQRFQELGLKHGSVIAIQAPNIVELPLIALGALRAGLVPAVVPPLWRERDLVRALEALAPKALVAPTRIDDDHAADRLRYVAAALFSVRFVLSFGPDTPDGVVALDDCFERPNGREPKPAPAVDEPGDAPAIVTFRTTSTGHAPLARSHNQWIAAGLATLLEGRMEPGETLATTMMQTSFAGLATGLMPWLLGGGTLHLHQPIDLALLERTIVDENVTRLVLPGGFAGEIATKLPIQDARALRSIVGVFVDPRRMVDARPVHGGIDAVDVAVFDEWALVARRRKAGRPTAIPLGPCRHPEEGANGPILVETRLTSTGRLELRGPMTPLDPSVESGFRTTGLVGRERDGGFLVTQRIDQVAQVGGLGVGLEDVAEVLREIAPVRALKAIAVADPLFGERIEARYALEDGSTLGPEALDAQFRDALGRVAIAPHKIPSRVVMDPTVGARARAP